MSIQIVCEVVIPRLRVLFIPDHCLAQCPSSIGLLDLYSHSADQRLRDLSRVSPGVVGAIPTHTVTGTRPGSHAIQSIASTELVTPIRATPTSGVTVPGNIGTMQFRSQERSTIDNGVFPDGNPLSSTVTSGERSGEHGAITEIPIDLPHCEI